MHLNGEYVSKSSYSAFSYFQKVTNKGHVAAQYYFGLMYYLGDGTRQDFNQAVAWLVKSADAGDEDAQKMLGYKNGKKPDTSRISFVERLAMKYEYDGK
jgi:TPR repeat protein